jgi:hypothetical protein
MWCTTVRVCSAQAQRRRSAGEAHFSTRRHTHNSACVVVWVFCVCAVGCADFMGYSNLYLHYTGARDTEKVFEVAVRDGPNPAGAVRLVIALQVEPEKTYVGTCLCKKTKIQVSATTFAAACVLELTSNRHTKQVVGKPLFSGFCHCTQCAKFGNSDRSLTMGYARDKLTVLDGQALLTSHKLTRVTRFFCSVCGTGMYQDAGTFLAASPTVFGANDEYRLAQDMVPQMHIHYGSSCLYGVVKDGTRLPLFKDFPKQIGGSGEVIRE